MQDDHQQTRGELMMQRRSIETLFGIAIPIVQAPMAGANGAEMVIAVSEAGGLGSLPCAMLSPEQMRTQVDIIRQRTARPINMNFFCHRSPGCQPEREAAWKQRLAVYFRELGLDPSSPVATPIRVPFDEAACEVAEELKPEVVSFHFGLPDKMLVQRVKAVGAKIISSATTVSEARWLEDNGCDAIISQGYEAGGHRGMFLSDDLATQVGTFALLPQIVDAVTVPVIAAGGIADGRGIAAALLLGASGVQIGTAYLFTPQATISPMHREALGKASTSATALTNVFTGRPARSLLNRVVREVGPMSDDTPPFPLAASAIGPIRMAAEAAGSGEFSPLWSGQAAALGRQMEAGELTRLLMSDARDRLCVLSQSLDPRPNAQNPSVS